MERYLHNFVSAFVLLITLVSAVAAQSQLDESTTDGARTGKISGRVVNESGQPLADALINPKSGVKMMVSRL